MALHHKVNTFLKKKKKKEKLPYQHPRKPTHPIPPSDGPPSLLSQINHNADLLYCKYVLPIGILSI